MIFFKGTHIPQVVSGNAGQKSLLEGKDLKAFDSHA